MNKIAVLIPHYNNSKGLIKSLESIGVFEKLDVVVVDDGSKIEQLSEDLLNESFKAGGKVKVIFLENNKGVSIACNIGLEYIIKKKYKYTARLDAGDLCVNNRFQKQLAFLEKNPSIKLVGSSILANDTSGNYLYKVKYPTEHQEIKKRMYLNAMFINPTIFFETEILKKIGMYPTNYDAAEDYAFFFNIIKEFKTANIIEPLVTIEINPVGISISKRKIQVKSRIRLIFENFYFGFWPIYGLIRNIILYIIPNSIILRIKKIVK